MNLFKLLNISALFILLCLGLTISSTMKEVDAPFLTIPRVAFETTVPGGMETQSSPHKAKFSQKQLADNPIPDLLSTNFFDGLLPALPSLEDIVGQFPSLNLDEPLPRITIEIDSSNSSISFSLEQPIRPLTVIQAVDEKPSLPEISEVHLEETSGIIELPNSDSENTLLEPVVLEPEDDKITDSIQLPADHVQENVDSEVAISSSPEIIEVLNVQEIEAQEEEIVGLEELNDNAPSIEMETDLFAANSYSPMVYQLPRGENPLTGLAPAAEENLERRPMMVKISNFPRSGRPQAGLSYADMVFEYYIGEEMNRFLAIYYGSDSPQVGPIRSGALVDSQIATLYQGILNYGNEDPQMDGLLTKSLESRVLPVWRCPSPAIVGADSDDINGVFGNSYELSNLADKLNISNSQPYLNGMVFSDDIPEDTEDGLFVAVEYSERNRGEWHFDPDSGLYARWSENFQDGDYVMEPLYDRVNNQQIKFANIIIIAADYDEVNRTRYKIDLTGNRDGDKAVIFRDGVMIYSTWKVTAADQPIQFFDLEGDPVALKPGNTWIVIADTESDFEEVDHGEWELNF